MRSENNKKKRQRTCYDRARKRWLEARRVQATNPAASAATQLLGVFGLMLGRMPIVSPMPVPYVAPPMSPRQEQKNETARRLGIPTRYLDIVLKKGKVPYGLLFEHIRLGGATRRDALDELRKLIPTETADWLNHVEERELWSDLSRCFHPDASDEDTQVQLLKATLAWIESQKKSDDPALVSTETKYGLEPPKPGGNEDPHNDPKPPTP